MSEETFKTKEINGLINFYYDHGNLSYVKCNGTDMCFNFADIIFQPSQLFQPVNIYDLIPGNEFAEYIKCGEFIDDDGSIADVFVDGYKSNLGIYTRNFQQGNFMVDLDTFKHLCKRHKIEVNWANR